MITWAWRRELDPADAAEVADLLAEAAAYDAEAGFSTARLDGDGTGERHHLVVEMPPVGSRGSAELDALPDVRVVAYLCLTVSEGVGAVQFVVRPPFRSRGVATLLAEQLDADARGWAAVPGVAELRVWAHGAHPAAGRMADRFGASVEDAVFRTLRMIGGSRPFVAELAAVRRAAAEDQGWESVPGHRRSIAPDDLEILGRAEEELSLVAGAGRALIGVSRDDPARDLATLTVLRDGAETRAELKVLITQALLVLQADGARMVQSHVPALDDAMVSVARELDLVHDQSDLLYRRRLAG
ncbi:hypothetical protein [Nocardioides daejeonensis]|uniref:hypothetical protein n=1 Tax=Nocardioides daejeonensis TaxID=1046556 RepID=UPI000D74252F|nr:hypothetical protein [Nocardioides daejeonensis]